MANDSSNWNAIMQYSFIRIFANDGSVDVEELAMLERLAMADGVVDERERRVLSGIFSRVDAEGLDTQIRDGIDRFKARHQIP